MGNIISLHLHYDINQASIPKDLQLHSAPLYQFKGRALQEVALLLTPLTDTVQLSPRREQADYLPNTYNEGGS
jgi:hypothetical protein